MERDNYNKLHNYIDKILEGWTLNAREQKEYEALCDEWNDSQRADMQRLNTMANVSFDEWLLNDK
jgi:hypothetical protein